MFNIEIYKERLNQEIRTGKMKRKTADDYVVRLEELNCKLPEEANCQVLAETIVKVSAQTQGKKYIQAIKKYESRVVGAPGIYLYGEPLKKLYQRYKEKDVVEITHDVDTYKRKINGISREHMRFKLALRLQMKSGLRVAELAALEKRDIDLKEDGSIELLVRRGKGNLRRSVEGIEDKWLYAELTEFLEQLADEEHVFDSADKIMRFAKKLDIKTHELRKVYAQVSYREKRESGKRKMKARKEVGTQLGHVGKTAGNMTNKYLGKEWTSEQKKRSKKTR